MMMLFFSLLGLLGVGWGDETEGNHLPAYIFPYFEVSGMTMTGTFIGVAKHYGIIQELALRCSKYYWIL